MFITKRGSFLLAVRRFVIFVKIACRFHFQTTDSTQLFSLRELEAGRWNGSPFPILVSANVQTDGKGQKNHSWFSAVGCLMFSFLFSPASFGIPLARTPLLGLACVLALRDTLQQILPPEFVKRLKIHWPNDLFCQMEDGTFRKMSGILLNGHTSGIMVAGIGINLLNSAQNAPQELQNRLLSLSDLFPEWVQSPALAEVSPLPEPGFPEPMERFLDLFLDELEQKLNATAKNPQISIVREIEKYCVQRGKIVTIQTPQGNVTGFCSGLAEDGAILIDSRPFRDGIVSLHRLF